MASDLFANAALYTPSEPEALDNIRDAIRDYLAVVEQQLQSEDIREIEVAP